MPAQFRSMFTSNPRRQDRRVLVTNLKGKKTWISERAASAMTLDEFVSLACVSGSRRHVKVGAR